MYLNTAKSLVYQGKFSIDEKMPGMVTGTDGKYYSAGGLGWTLVLAIPLWINKITNGNIANIEFLATFVNPLLAFCLLIVSINLYSLISKDKKVGLLIAFIIIFSTNLLPLAKHSFAHILSILAMTTALYFGLKYLKTKNTKNLIFSGLFYGLLIISYNYTFVISSFAFFLVLVIKKSFDKKIFFKWVLGVIPFVLILFAYNYFRFGNILESGYTMNGPGGDLKLKASVFEGLWGLLLSPGKSILVYSPVLIYSFYLAIKYFKKNWVDLFFLITAVVNVFLYSNLAFWSGELSYGPRYLAVIIPFGGLVLANHWKEINKKIIIVLVLLGLWVQFVGVSIPYTKQYEWYDMEFMCVGSQGLTRKGEFDYWSIGEFIPRYSPPYRLKKKVVEVVPPAPELVAVTREGEELRMGDEVTTNYHKDCAGKIFIVCDIVKYDNCESGFMVVVHLKDFPERKILGLKKEGHTFQDGLDCNHFNKVKSNAATSNIEETKEEGSVSS